MGKDDREERELEYRYRRKSFIPPSSAPQQPEKERRWLSLSLSPSTVSTWSSFDGLEQQWRPRVSGVWMSSLLFDLGRQAAHAGKRREST